MLSSTVSSLFPLSARYQSRSSWKVLAGASIALHRQTIQRHGLFRSEIFYLTYV